MYVYRKIEISHELIRISPDWNVNVQTQIPTYTQQDIRISPDWNVNLLEVISRALNKYIRISPDWNVNILFNHNENRVLGYSNITRLECKCIYQF